MGKYSCLVNASHIHSLHLYVDDSYHPSTYPKKLTENVSVIEGKAYGQSYISQVLQTEDPLYKIFDCQDCGS